MHTRSHYTQSHPSLMTPCYLKPQRTYTFPNGTDPLHVAAACDRNDPESLCIAAIYLPNQMHASSAEIVISFPIKGDLQTENFKLSSPSSTATFSSKSWRITWSSYAQNLLVTALEMEVETVVGPRFWLLSPDKQLESRYRLLCSQFFSDDILDFQWNTQSNILSQFGHGEKHFLLVLNDAKIVYLYVQDIISGRLLLDARKWHCRLVSCAYHQYKGTLALSGDISATDCSQSEGASSWSLWQVSTIDCTSTSLELLDSTLMLGPTEIEHCKTICGSIVDQSFSVDGQKLCMLHGEGFIAIRELEICENVIQWRRVNTDPTGVVNRATFLNNNLLVFQSNSQFSFTTVSLAHFKVFGTQSMVYLMAPEPHGHHLISIISISGGIRNGIQNSLCICTLVTKVFSVIAALIADDLLNEAVDLLKETPRSDAFSHEEGYQRVWEQYCRQSSSSASTYRIVHHAPTQEAAFRALQNIQSDSYIEQQSLCTIFSTAESMERMLQLSLTRASVPAASQLRRWLYRLGTMKLLAPTLRPQAEWYDSHWYLEFRDINLVDMAMHLASSRHIDALKVLWMRNKWNLVCHRLSILACLPISPHTHTEWIPVIAPDDAVFYGLNAANDVVKLDLEQDDNKRMDLSDEELRAITEYTSLSYTHRLEEMASAFHRLFIYWDDTFGQLATVYDVLELLPSQLLSHRCLASIRDAIKQLHSAEYRYGLSIGVRFIEWQIMSTEDRMRLVITHPHICLGIIRSIFLTSSDRLAKRRAVNALCACLVDQKPLCMEILMDSYSSEEEKTGAFQVLANTLENESVSESLVNILLQNCPVDRLGSLLHKLRQLETPAGLDITALEHYAPNERYTRLQLGLTIASDKVAWLQALCTSSIQADSCTRLDELQVVAYHHSWILHSLKTGDGFQTLLLYWKEHIKMLTHPQLSAFLTLFRELENESPRLTELTRLCESQIHSSTRVDTLLPLGEAFPSLQVDQFYEDAMYRGHVLESLATQQSTYSIAVSFATQFEMDPYNCLLAYIEHAFKTSQPLQPFDSVHPIQEALTQPSKLVPFLLKVYNQLSGTDYTTLILVFRLLLECYKRLQKSPSANFELKLSDACYRRWTLLYVCLKRLKDLSEQRIDFKLMAERENGQALMGDTCCPTHSVALKAVLPFVSAQNIKLISKILLQLHQIPVSSFVLLYMNEMCGRMESAADLYEACYPFLPVLSDEDLVNFYDAFVGSMISSKESTQFQHLQRVGDQLTQDKQLEVRVDLVSRIRGRKDERMKRDILLNALWLLQRDAEDTGWMEMILKAHPEVDDVLACLREKTRDVKRLDRFLRVVRGMMGVHEAQIMIMLTLFLCEDVQPLQVCWIQERFEMVMEMLTDMTVKMATGWQPTHHNSIGEPAFLYDSGPPEMKDLLRFLEWSCPRSLDAGISQVFTQIQALYPISSTDVMLENQPLSNVVESRWLHEIARCVDTNSGAQGLMLAQAILLHYRTHEREQQLYDLIVDGKSAFKDVYFAFAFQTVAGSETIEVELDLDEKTDELLRSSRPHVSPNLNTIAGVIALYDILQGITSWNWEQEVNYATCRQLMRLVQKQLTDPTSRPRGSCWDRLLREQEWSPSDWILWYQKRAYGRVEEETILTVIETSDSNSFAAHVALLCPFPKLRDRFHGQIVSYCVSCARGTHTEKTVFDLALLRYDLKELLAFDVVIYRWLCRELLERKVGKENSICSSMEYFISAAIVSEELEIAGRLNCAFQRVHPSLYAFDISQILLQRWSNTFERALVASRVASEPVKLLLMVVTKNNELLKRHAK
ncbi:unnamed protein product [Albugo candida]|uniref:Uncharacterized protein n=1 Tax=Albugo candida TaxID=65357 RepID=A0A024FTW9_9STRA|nr:unnamed protein product [Albugo candida]|eukprot:CCI10560.1 unnamed protein product [Albugo candida]